MGRIAQLTKQARDGGFLEKENDVTVNRCDNIASLGSACTDNEECYLQAKLFRTLGIVYFEHQARV
jgi:formate dehydrogenase major subunit